MNKELQYWVNVYTGRHLHVIYSHNKKSKPHVTEGLIFVGIDWLTEDAERDPELKRLLVMEEL